MGLFIESGTIRLGDMNLLPRSSGQLDEDAGAGSLAPAGSRFFPTGFGAMPVPFAPRYLLHIACGSMRQPLATQIDCLIGPADGTTVVGGLHL